MDLAATTLVTVLLVIAAVLLHYETLLNASRSAERMTIPPRSRILVVIAAAFLAHLAEVALFATAFAGMERAGLGALVGDVGDGPVVYFYFSLTTYTTLGVGDVAPVGAMRILAAIEALTGLVLITWTASFTFIAMQRFWNDH